MGGVIIGMDPHKASATIEVRDEREVLLATGRFGTDTAGYRVMLRYCRQWPNRVWAVEGANGTGRPLSQRLLADGERVWDVPAKLAARTRVFDSGHARKTDAHDAHAIVMVALRTRGLRQLQVDEKLAVLRLLADRRDELSRTRAQILNRLHRLLAELVGGGAKRDLSSFKARALLATVRPRDLPGRTRRQLAADLIGELESTDRKLKELTKRLREAVTTSGSGLLDVFGIGPAGAARILADVGDVARFPDRNHFASWTGTAPIDASSGEQLRHRLSRAGNRRLNHVLYMAGIVQMRHDTPGRAYYRRKLAEGKTPMRCLRRRLSDVIYRQLVADAASRADHDRQAGPGGHPGATVQSSAADRSPDIGTSDQPLPGPAPTTLPAPTPVPQTPAASQPPPPLARPRRQRGAPHRTNDVDADQRRRTIPGRRDRALDTTP